MITIHVTDHITLKQIELSDAPDVFHIINTQREYLREWLPFVDYTVTVADSEAFIRSIYDVPEESRELVFAIQYDRQFAGLIGYKDTDFANRRTELGYWLSETLQGKGIVSRSVKALTDYAFRSLGMNRIQIKCGVGNTSSSNIPKRLNFTFEGIERDGECVSENVFRDIEVYSFLKREL